MLICVAKEIRFPSFGIFWFVSDYALWVATAMTSMLNDKTVSKLGPISSRVHGTSTIGPYLQKQVPAQHWFTGTMLHVESHTMDNKVNFLEVYWRETPNGTPKANRLPFFIVDLLILTMGLICFFSIECIKVGAQI